MVFYYIVGEALNLLYFGRLFLLPQHVLYYNICSVNAFKCSVEYSNLFVVHLRHNKEDFNEHEF